jgi:hypothetical protein
MPPATLLPQMQHSMVGGVSEPWLKFGARGRKRFSASRNHRTRPELPCSRPAAHQVSECPRLHTVTRMLQSVIIPTAGGWSSPPSARNISSSRTGTRSLSPTRPRSCAHRAPRAARGTRGGSTNRNGGTRPCASSSSGGSPPPRDAQYASDAAEPPAWHGQLGDPTQLGERNIGANHIPPERSRNRSPSA